jgi:hypothetical protein
MHGDPVGHALSGKVAFADSQHVSPRRSSLVVSRCRRAHEIMDPADEDKRAFIWRLLLAKVFFSLKPCERHRIVLLQ